MEPVVSVVIVTWNAKEITEKCLQSIFGALLDMPFEVIVVDNASSDGTKEMVLQEFPNVRLISNEENIGYGPAHNKGFQRSRGRYLLVLNNDVMISNDSLRKMVDYMDTHLDVGLMGGRLQNLDGTFQPSANRRFPNLLDVFFEEFFFLSSLRYLFFKFPFGAHCMKLFWDRKEPHPVAWVGGACMMVRRKTIDQVGFFDEHFFFYREDCDLCLRIWKSGWKIMYDPRNSFTHVWGYSSKKNKQKISMESRRSLLYYFFKHHSRLSFWIAKYFVLGGLCLRYLLLSIVQLVKKDKRDDLTLFRKMLSVFCSIKDPSATFHVH